VKWTPPMMAGINTIWAIKPKSFFNRY